MPGDGEATLENTAHGRLALSWSIVQDLITVVLVWGIKESSNFNAIMVLIKILVLLFFIGLALYYVSPATMAENWKPFQPQGWF